MSPKEFLDLVVACQKELGVKPDGDPREITWRAIYKHLTGREWEALAPEPVAPVVAPVLGTPPPHVDERSEKNIATLNPAIQDLARQLVIESGLQGIDARVISGTRTYEEQAELRRKYEAGGPKAARPGFSNHNFGLAFDIGVFHGSEYIEEGPSYTRVGKIGQSLGLIWGGSWGGKDEDPPHFELRPRWAKDLTEGETITGLRDRKEAGKDLLA